MEEEFKTDYGRLAYLKADENGKRINNLEGAGSRHHYLQFSGGDVTQAESYISRISAYFFNGRSTDIYIEAVAAVNFTKAAAAAIDVYLDDAKIESSGFNSAAGKYNYVLKRVVKGVRYTGAGHILSFMLRSCTADGAATDTGAFISYNIVISGDSISKISNRTSLTGGYGLLSGRTVLIKKDGDRIGELYEAEAADDMIKNPLREIATEKSCAVFYPYKIDLRSQKTIITQPADAVYAGLESGKLYITDNEFFKPIYKKRKIAENVKCFAVCGCYAYAYQGIIFYLSDRLYCRKIFNNGEVFSVSEQLTVENFDGLGTLGAFGEKIEAIYACLGGDDGTPNLFLGLDSGDIYLKRTEPEASFTNRELISAACSFTLAEEV
jgi:hypothetical protein